MDTQHYCTYPVEKTAKCNFNCPYHAHFCASNKHVPQMLHICHMPKSLSAHQWRRYVNIYTIYWPIQTKTAWWPTDTHINTHRQQFVNLCIVLWQSKSTNDPKISPFKTTTSLHCKNYQKSANKITTYFPLKVENVQNHPWKLFKIKSFQDHHTPSY